VEVRFYSSVPNCMSYFHTGGLSRINSNNQSE